MLRIHICKKCDKPKAKAVNGRPMKGKKLIQALEKENLSFEVVPCKCLGKCKKGPNGMVYPGKVRLHRLSVETLRELSFD